MTVIDGDSVSGADFLQELITTQWCACYKWDIKPDTLIILYE